MESSNRDDIDKKALLEHAALSYPQLTDSISELSDREFAVICAGVRLDYQTCQRDDPIEFLHGLALDFDRANEELIRRTNKRRQETREAN